jgi:hypothetical protein
MFSRSLCICMGENAFYGDGYVTVSVTCYRTDKAHFRSHLRLNVLPHHTHENCSVKDAIMVGSLFAHRLYEAIASPES